MSARYVIVSDPTDTLFWVRRGTSTRNGEWDEEAKRAAEKSLARGLSPVEKPETRTLQSPRVDGEP